MTQASTSQHLDASRFNLKSLWANHHPAFAVIGNVLFLVLAVIAGRMGAIGWEKTFYVVAYISGGTFSLIEGVQSLTKEKRIDVDLLMVLAALAAASIGEWLDGGVLLFLFSLSNAMEFYAMDRTRHAITSLMQKRPEEALLKGEDGQVRVVPGDTLVVGDVIIVRPGQLIPIDGKIVAGFSSVDEATITGESVPVDKGVGDDVFGGTLNQNGALEIRVTKLTEDTVISKIIQMVEEAQSDASPTQTKIDTIEQYYALGVIGLTIIMAIVPVMLGMPKPDAIYRAITLMVVASPCAVAMAVPAPVVAGIANGAASGILYKGGMHMENMADVEVVAFDKTGTLTDGRPVVTDIVAIGDYDESEVLSMAASIESLSEHPIARAIMDKAQQEGLSTEAADDTQAVPGMGVMSRIRSDNGWVGNKRMLEQYVADVPRSVTEKAEALEREGKTVMFIGKGEHLVGLAAVVDQVRPGVATMIAELKKQGIKQVVMLTGDNKTVARAVAAQVGVDQVFAGLLPEEKAEVIVELRNKYGAVAMVGDGVNDAPALAHATVGVAMGAAGTDVALETADVVLMSDDLGKINHAVNLSRRARKIIWQNITFALGVIAVLIVIVLTRGLHLSLGVIGHEGSTVLVIFNSLRLLFGQDKTTTLDTKQEGKAQHQARQH